MITKAYKLKDVINKAGEVSAWTKRTFTCVSCRRKRRNANKLDTPIGDLCTACVEKGLHDVVRSENIALWSVAQFKAALSEEGDLPSRLIVLKDFDHVLRLTQAKHASERPALLRLLVQNLGYIREHPLTHQVRQSAFDACKRLNDEIVPTLLNTHETEPWQLYANVIMLLAELAPRNQAAWERIRKAAEDAHPEVRDRAQTVLIKNLMEAARIPNPGFSRQASRPNKKQRLEQIISTLGPEAQKQVQIGVDRAKTFHQPIQLEDPQEQKMEKLVGSLYNADVLKKIYTHYLHDRFFGAANFSVSGKFSINKLKKADTVTALAKVYSNEALFQEFYANLPKAVQDIFQLLVWDGEEYEAEHLEKTFKTTIVKSDRGYSAGSTALRLHDSFLLFQVREQYVWGGISGRSYRFYLSLDAQLRKPFKAWLPHPEGYDLTPLAKIEKTDYFYTNQDRILTQIKLYYNYIAQGNLNFSKSTGKMLKSSLTQMAKYCHIDEFYQTKDKNFQYLATRLIIDTLQGVKCDDSQAPHVLLKKMFQDFFKHKHTGGIHLYDFLYHLKGGYYEYQYEKRERRVKKALLKVLKAFPVSQWLAFENVEKYCSYRDIPLDVVQKQSRGNDLYFNRTYQRSYYSNYERTYVRSSLYKEAVVVPFLKTMLFLCAAFGIVDIAYDLPKNPIIQERNQAYLTVFDGLRYVRLTPLGAYIVGLTKNYEVKIEETSANVILDPNRLIATLEGQDPIKTLVLEKIGEPFGTHCYRISYHSFLKECATQADVHQHIDLFREHIAVEPPRIWQEFLQELEQKINPLSSKPRMAVFKIKPGKALISLIARDEILKRYILKGEDYHILIAGKDIPKVKKRLEEFGYFIDNI